MDGGGADLPLRPVGRAGMGSRAAIGQAEFLVAAMALWRLERTTYFVDLREGKNGQKYLSISENKISNEKGKERVTLRIFGETIDQFRQAVDEAAKAVVQ